MHGKQINGSLCGVKKGATQSKQREEKTMDRVLDEYDATQIVGLSTIVCGAAIFDEDADTIEVPKLRELMVTAAVARCLMPIRLRGFEIRAVRKIMRYTLAELAKKMSEQTATETMSRWESDAQPMGGFAEKILRLVACEVLATEAPGIEYKGAMIADMIVVDPWRTDPAFEVPPVVLSLVKMKEKSGSIINAWDLKRAA